MYIGIDIGGTKTLVAASTTTGKLERTSKIPTPHNAGSELRELFALTRALADKAPIKAIVVAVPGSIDRKKGRLLLPPNLPWRNIDFLGPLKKHFRGVPVAIENDASAAALAEAKLGAGRNHKHVLYVTISTGIGTGIVQDGKLYYGAFTSEGGHMTIRPTGPACGCGGRGHFEAVVSGLAIERRFGRPASEITDTETWELICADLALGLGNMITLLSPDIVVLGGGVSTHYNRFIKPLKSQLERLKLLYPIPPIVEAEFPETAVAHGCIILAAEL